MENRFLMETNALAMGILKEAEGPDVGGVIKELINTSWSGDNESQGKAVQLLKGLAFSDDPRANKFMAALDKFTSSLKPEQFAESKSIFEANEIVIDAEIRWFDSMKGEGLLRMPDGKSPAFSYTQIKGVDQRANHGNYPSDKDQEKLDKYAKRGAKVKVYIKGNRYDRNSTVEIKGLK